MVPNRVGLAVWLHSMKPLKQLKRHGHVHYVSRKMKYAVVYCDEESMTETIEKIASISAVKHVEPSMRPWVKTEYQSAVPDKEKSDDYKMGI
ncbi:YlbG family protein [Salisediminibacterium halotolerans]|uniref:UPF0298 protein SAMN05444126_10222 n=1 Tax=Salisediminibacterium halotolerans TaxID=517425 RepID=A0A1H9PSY5_9BACI|nr:DUF2129 domain-containing protein [Salisediminibacterium haloalkalitolerans]SER51337.1 Uncharacterized protein YlbG, UPF0298 family [Salisediminibacterium haloalkalitolerans]